jgi:hypothetical protein
MKLTQAFYTRTGAALGTIVALQAGVAHADTTAFDGNNSQIPISGSADFSTATNGKEQFISLANTALNLVLLVVGVLAVFYLIYSGFLYITSGGNPDNVKKARAGIINSIVGIIIILAAFVIVRFAVGIGNVVGNAN